MAEPEVARGAEDDEVPDLRPELRLDVDRDDVMHLEPLPGSAELAVRVASEQALPDGTPVLRVQARVADMVQEQTHGNFAWMRIGRPYRTPSSAKRTQIRTSRRMR